MYYGLENKNIQLQQLEGLHVKGYYGKNKIKKVFSIPEYKRNEKGKIIPLTKEEDALAQLLEILKPGDTVVTSTLANFSFKAEGIFRMLDAFFERGVHVIAILEDFDSRMLDMSTYAILSRVTASAAKAQRKAQMKGIQTAKSEGRYGRNLSAADFPDFPQLLEQYQSNDITKVEFARKLGISRPTLDKLLREQE